MEATDTTAHLSFTQPSCFVCWYVHNGERIPHRVTHTQKETCCYCGNITYAGIYVRIDPSTVVYPTSRKDE